MSTIAYSRKDIQAHYGKKLVEAHLAKSSEAKSKAIVEAAGAAQLAERGGPGVVEGDLADVARIERSLNVLAADRKNPADKRMAQADREYSDHLLDRLSSAIKSITTGDVKQLERAVVDCEKLLQSQPGTNGIVEYLKKVSAKTKAIKLSHTQAQEDAARLKHAKECLERADQQLHTKTVKELLAKG